MSGAGAIASCAIPPDGMGDNVMRRKACGPPWRWRDAGGRATSGGMKRSITRPVPRRPARRRAAASLAAVSLAVSLLAVLARPGPAWSAAASPWASAAQSRARLIEGAPAGGMLLAGLEVRLEPGFITYWRDPGDAGVPPTVSFAGSTNLKSAAMRYPAPKRLDEAGAVAFGYVGDVTFPILVEPVDPSRPVTLALALDYAACHEICLPAHADLRLTLDGQPSAEAGRVADALAAVPRVAVLGGPGSPAIRAVTPDGAGGFTVAAAGAGPDGTLFVEAPEGWAFAVGPARPDGAETLFPVKRIDRPKGVERLPGPVTLTLAGRDGAIEVPVRVDVARPNP